jgi:hypothetical protein
MTHIDLVMCQDNNQIILTSKNSKHDLHFVDRGRSDHVQDLNRTLANATKKKGGTVIESPLYVILGPFEVFSSSAISNRNTIIGNMAYSFRAAQCTW